MACDGDSANGGRAAMGSVPGRRRAGEADVYSPGAKTRRRESGSKEDGIKRIEI